MSKSARPGPKRRTLKQSPIAAKVELPAASGVVEKPGTAKACVTPAAFEFTAKQRCQGATRYGQSCRLWATAGGEFCYWCERAGRPRYPLARPAGEAASPADTASVRKQRCRGVTVFGEPCGYFSAGDGGLCLWCQGADKRGKNIETHQ
jgi:hypothetical protein